MAKKATASGTDARAALTKNLERTRALQRIFDADSLRPKGGEKRGRGNTSAEERQLLRAVVVFAVGSLDSYLSDAAAEVLVGQLEKARIPNAEARGLLRRITKEIDTLPLELALTSDPEERLTLAKEAITDHLANRVSNHGAKGVGAMLARLDAGVRWDEIDVSKFPSLKTKASGAGGAAQILDAWTDVRHQLVHQGKAVRVTADQSRELTDFVECVADYVDGLALAALA